jgi:acetate---CoA ligase (ADP-forming)
MTLPGGKNKIGKRFQASFPHSRQSSVYQPGLKYTTISALISQCEKWNGYLKEEEFGILRKQDFLRVGRLCCTKHDRCKELVMDKFFNPQSIVIIGLSAKKTNIARLILENLLRWGYCGRIFGMNPTSEDAQVTGIRIYQKMEDLPEVPDLAVCFTPARFVPGYLEACGKFGIKNVAVPSGGFTELSEEGKKLSDSLIEIAKKYSIRFMGPNGLMTANTANGLCLPFLPLFRPPVGRLSVISQSGGLGLMLWHLMTNENVGMAKFASIGNKLNVDEVDVLEYLDKDPETGIICMYLESVANGSRLVKAAQKAKKPIVIYKSNTTSAGKKAAFSHTAALSNDEDTINAAFDEAGIIRISDFSDFIAVAKAFDLPPMHGNRVMIMSPYGGFSVITADLCEKAGLEFADPGQEFYDGLNKFTNAGVIKFSNPLDMGDIYDAYISAHVGYEVLHSDKVDGAIYVGQTGRAPEGDNVFANYLSADVSKDNYGAMLSSGKPLAICLFGRVDPVLKAKLTTNYPIFNSAEEMVRAMVWQKDWYARAAQKKETPSQPDIKKNALKKWLASHDGKIGEESLELLGLAGIPVPGSGVASDAKAAADIAEKIGYPVVMKVVSPDAVHKSDAGGVVIGVKDREAVKKYFAEIKDNLEKYKSGARFDGVQVQKMAAEGYDMYIGGKYDQSFGSVVLFGLGGIYVETFKDIQLCLCPADPALVRKKIESLKSFPIINGARGMNPADVNAFVDTVVRISWMLAESPEIKELDINPLRLMKDGVGACALDARMSIKK